MGNMRLLAATTAVSDRSRFARIIVNVIEWNTFQLTLLLLADLLVITETSMDVVAVFKAVYKGNYFAYTTIAVQIKFTTSHRMKLSTISLIRESYFHK